jgi:ubiquinone/menaquinone biosynthesis C-methylase UbiE
MWQNGLLKLRPRISKFRTAKGAIVDGMTIIDTAEIVGDCLELNGWAATLGAGPVDGFKLTLGGTQPSSVDITTGLPSPDVQSAFPRFDSADHCRFRIRARIHPNRLKDAPNSVIACIPLANGREGRIVIKLIEPLLPAASLEDSNSVGGQFVLASTEFLGYFIQLAGLKPSEDVLDVGCGVGRMAYMLAHYLEPTVRYEGFDIVERLIHWAQESITPRFPNFQFQHSNIYNKYYNPSATELASDYRFPFADDSFDFVFLTSVFTHMLADDLRHYLDEIYRVLRPGGHCLATCFLLNEESKSTMVQSNSLYNFRHPLVECFTTNPEVPEDAIGYDEDLLLGWITERGFRVTGKHYGWWCGGERLANCQDMLILNK